MRKEATKYYVLSILLLLISASLSDASIVDKIKDVVVVTAERIQGWNLSMHEALWYEKITGGSVRCQLCPFKCTLSEGQRGMCGVRANVGGKLRAMTYGKPVAVHIDPIEKKPLFHFLPTSTSYSIATVGCNLSCIFCQNWTISQALPEEGQHVDLSPGEIITQAMLNGCKSISYTYSEPTVFFEYMYDTGLLAKQVGIKNVWVTCGFINPEPLRQLCQVLDAANVDIKGPQSFYQTFTKSLLAPVLQTCKILKEEGVWVEITYLLVPEANDDPDSIRAICRWIADSLGKDIPLHFSRFQPNYKLTDRPPTPVETLHRARQIALEEGILYVYIGNVPGDEGEDTFCPQTGEKIIDRTGFWILDNRLSPDGKCGKNFVVNGVWR